MDPKDDVDVETLQAQIDMTMSFAHHLVTSWIKPAHRAQLGSSSINATRILEEELGRPPRLGAGASIAMAPLVHEASKLRRRLTKNGAKNVDAVKSRPEDSFKSDDEEHKGRPTKRKTKVDPFDPEGKKKKRKVNPEANRCLAINTVSKQSVSPLKNSNLGEQKQKPSPGKEKQGIELDGHRTRESQSATAVRWPTLPICSLSPTAHAASSLSTPLQNRHGPSRIHATSIPAPDKANSLGISLLNLDGPPELTDEPGNPNGLSNSRRKRKRRKRKKTQASASTADSLH